MDNGDSKSGHEANAERAHCTANRYIRASAADGRKQLAGGDASDHSPAYICMITLRIQASFEGQWPVKYQPMIHPASHISNDDNLALEPNGIVKDPWELGQVRDLCSVRMLTMVRFPCSGPDVDI